MGGGGRLELCGAGGRVGGVRKTDNIYFTLQMQTQDVHILAAGHDLPHLPGEMFRAILSQFLSLFSRFFPHSFVSSRQFISVNFSQILVRMLVHFRSYKTKTHEFLTDRKVRRNNTQCQLSYTCKHPQHLDPWAAQFGHLIHLAGAWCRYGTRQDCQEESKSMEQPHAKEGQHVNRPFGSPSLWSCGPAISGHTTEPLPAAPLACATPEARQLPTPGQGMLYIVPPPLPPSKQGAHQGGHATTRTKKAPVSRFQ